MELLTDEQATAYGRFVEEPTRRELERSFFLDNVDRDLIAGLFIPVIRAGPSPR